MKINPESTINFRNAIKKQAENGIFLTKILHDKNEVSLRIFPEVFPPQPDFFMWTYLKEFNIKEMEIADIGTGSGVEAIFAAILGAKHVDAIDINPIAVQCAKENAILNNIDNKINFFHSDLFEYLKNNKKYDLILANLPFIDFDGGKNLIDLALYDNGFIVHKKFFQQVHKYLADDGKILFPHANLQSGMTPDPDSDFDKLEKLINASGFKAKIIVQKTFREKYFWRLYELKLK